ncbi:hypothetical protein KIH74_29715 [Kineosporia sp. J2-2]|uniref:Deoxyribonuclease NucA/NucB domain-containing protein n=1 Tax=Kineosporia corallincola TaxID=2835133 RepID=A0ABS5TR65_9ACTN|nr:NucA/NucB deoxyribonuclease domain-containing protein [Kineosporia corallincola]MBT0773158.1 hypothetical protein [Kineosporia corallincola]
MKFAKEKWFTFHPEGQGGANGITSNVMDLSLHNFTRDAGGWPAFDATETWKISPREQQQYYVTTYGADKEGNLYWMWGSTTDVSVDTYHVQWNRDSYIRDPSQITGIYVSLRVRQTGSWVTDATIPVEHIKPVWKLQADYVCSGTNGEESGTVSGGTFDSAPVAPEFAPNVDCANGQYVTAWHAYVDGPNGRFDLYNWKASSALTDPAGRYASCLRLAGGSDCSLQRSTDGTQQICMWGNIAVPLSDCDFAEVFTALQQKKTRVQQYGEYRLAEDAQEEAYAAADTCLAYATVQQCKNLPIFMPGSDVFEAAQHDAFAILNSNQPAQLSYAETTERAPEGWYQSQYPCTDKIAGEHCDEYPFRSTLEGGPGASLRNIPGDANSKEGRLLGYFFKVCSVNVDNRPFLVIPLEGPSGASYGHPSQAWCQDGA